MTILEAIQGIDALKPNGYTETMKIQWLSVCDGIIKKEILDGYEGAEQIEFNGYNDETEKTTELLVKPPYDSEIYIAWLESKIDYSDGDYAKYNNSTLRFNDTLNAFRNAYNREHTHKQTNIKYY